MDAPQQLFDDLKREGVGLLRRWTEGRQEDLHLEFKTTKCPMETADKQNLSAAVSGFANSDGGVIVWGVYAAKDKEGIDAARSLQSIGDLPRFLTNLKDYCTQLVSPAAMGVEHLLLEDPPGTPIGYAVTYVPKGEGMPHMARAKDQHRYYYRAGESFLIMEPFMLADRFGRRPQPKLELSHHWEPDGGKTYAVFGITNVGRGIAIYPALQIEERSPQDFKIEALDTRLGDDIPGTKAYGLPERVRTLARPDYGWRTFAGTADDVIHPGTTVDVLRVGWHLAQQADARWRDITCRFAVHCDGFTSGQLTYVISADDVRNAAGF